LPRSVQSVGGRVLPSKLHVGPVSFRITPGAAQAEGLVPVEAVSGRAEWMPRRSHGRSFSERTGPRRARHDRGAADPAMRARVRQEVALAMKTQPERGRDQRMADDREKMRAAERRSGSTSRRSLAADAPFSRRPAAKRVGPDAVRDAVPAPVRRGGANSSRLNRRGDDAGRMRQATPATTRTKRGSIRHPGRSAGTAVGRGRQQRREPPGDRQAFVGALGRVGEAAERLRQGGRGVDMRVRAGNHGLGLVPGDAARLNSTGSRARASPQPWQLCPPAFRLAPARQPPCRPPP
jgi:general stress protein YciG